MHKLASVTVDINKNNFRIQILILNSNKNTHYAILIIYLMFVALSKYFLDNMNVLTANSGATDCSIQFITCTEAVNKRARVGRCANRFHYKRLIP